LAGGAPFFANGGNSVILRCAPTSAPRRIRPRYPGRPLRGSLRSHLRVTDNVHPSRDAMRPSFANHHAIQRIIVAPRGRRSAERRNANHLPRNISKRRRLLRYRRQVYANSRNSSAARLRAISEARSPSGASTAALAGTPIPAQLQAMLPGTRTARDPEKRMPVFRKRSRAAKAATGRYPPYPVPVQ
jgi:hypothetical protein